MRAASIVAPGVLGFALALAGVAPALLSCAEAPDRPPRAAPAKPRAVLVLEPPVVVLGDVVEVELAVVTRPDYAARALDLPGAIDGFWLIERGEQTVEKEPARWVHRRRLRLRAVEVGRFTIPGGSVEVTSPEGGTLALDYEPLSVEVVSTLSDHPTQQSPYGLRLLPLAARPGRGSLVAFAAGAALALASVGVALLARRRLARVRESGAPARPLERPAWELAREDLGRARQRLASDPRRALDRGAAALRAYAVRRFGGDATVRTSEELAEAEPPFTMTTRWSRFVELLAELDAARFPRGVPGAERSRELLQAVADFVEESVPREAREPSGRSGQEGSEPLLQEAREPSAPGSAE